MTIGKRAVALARSAFATVLAAMLALTMLPSAALAETSEVAGGGFTVTQPEADTASNTAEGAEGTEAAGSYDNPEQTNNDVEAEDGEDAAVSIPAATQRINEDVSLTAPVAQKEATRSYFLAQTLESTKTVPIVSANLPLYHQPEASTDGSDIVTGGSETFPYDGEEEGEGSDDPDPAASVISAESVVVGAFEYRGITYAVEPGGESVAVVAADYAKLPEEFVEAQTIVLPSMVSADEVDYYSVTRIADYAFATLTSEDNGITAITIPASVTSMEDDAFTGFDTLQYIIVAEDNPTYAMYDGCLYDADLTNLLLIPGGRLGAVRVPSNTKAIPENASSHCASLTSLIVEPDSAASQLLEGTDLYNANGNVIEIATNENAETSTITVEHTASLEVFINESISIVDQLEFELAGDAKALLASSADGMVAEEDAFMLSKPGSAAVAVIQDDGSQRHYAIFDVTCVASEESTQPGIESREGYEANNTGSWGTSVRNGELRINFMKHSRNFFTGRMYGEITWTAGTSEKPLPGSIVNVEVSTYWPSGGGEATSEQLVGAGLGWGGDETKELIGIRSTSTGSYVSIDSIYSGDNFSFSFVMPAADSVCTVSSAGVNWVSQSEATTFEPVFREKKGYIWSRFRLNADGAVWKNTKLKAEGHGNYHSVTYSEVGQRIVTPTAGLPTRSGYIFAGWYTEDGALISSEPASAIDNGINYYAHWEPIKNSMTYENAMLNIAPRSFNRCFLYDAKQFAGTVSWSSTSATPAAGDYVNVYVTKYLPDGGEGTRETLLNASLKSWGAENDEELVGIIETSTGSYLSVDTIYSGNAFTFSFVMPRVATDYCSITTEEVSWRGNATASVATTFEPVYRTRVNSIFSRFDVNGGTWENPATGQRSDGSFRASTFTTIGQKIVTPSTAIPVCDGYTFVGWYTEKTGGEVVSKIAELDDNDVEYFAHWAAKNYTLNISGSCHLAPLKSTRCFMHDAYSFKAVATWDKGSAQQPASDAVVTIRVTQYRPNSGEVTKENLMNAGLVWSGNDKSKRLIGIREKTTGSFIDLDSMYSGDTFTFSFVMSANVVSIKADTLVIEDNINGTSFEPVYEDSSNFIYNNFSLNAPVGEGSDPYWVNPRTGQVGGSYYQAATYSTVGETIIAPTDSIPMRDGYIFTGWYTEPVGGHVVSGNALEADNGKTYYAHWGNKDSVYYFLKLYGNGAINTAPITWSMESGKQFSLAARIFDKVGCSVTSYKNGDGSKSYEVEKLYPAFADGTTTELYAQWTGDVYNIEYKLMGGVKKEGGTYPESYDYGTGILHVTDPVRAGYRFMGWTGTGLTEPTFELQLICDINDKLENHVPGTALYTRTYTANWEPFTYSVEFRNSENRAQKMSDVTQEGTYGTPLKLAPGELKVSKTGHHVSGWTVGSGENAPTVEGVEGTLTTFDAAAPGEGGRTIALYCIWTPNAFSVKLHDGAREDVQTGFVYNGDSAITKPSHFTRTGYAIAGWSFSDGGSAVDIAFEGENATIASSVLAAKGKVPAEGGTIDLYAVWKMKSYDLYLSMNQAGTTLPQNVTGWTRGTGAGEGWTASEGDPVSDVIYTYKLDSGYTVGQTVPLPTPRGGIKRLAGWTGGAANEVKASTSADGASVYSFAPNASAAGFDSRTYTLLTAEWTDADYVIEWAFNYYDAQGALINGTYDDPEARADGSFDGFVLTTRTTYGAPIELPEIKSECYEFLGWYSTVDAALLATPQGGDIVGPYLKEGAEGGYVFEPADDGGRTTIRFFAGWSEQPVPYTITLKATEHGGRFLDGSSELVLPNAYGKGLANNDIFLTDNTPKAQEAGWKFAGWYEEVASPVEADPNATKLVDFPENTTIPRGSGNRTFVAKWKVTDDVYSITFHKGEQVSDENKPADYVSMIGESSATFNASTSSIAIPQLRRTETAGYTFKGWYRATEQNGSFVATEERIPDGTVSFEGQDLVTEASGLDTTVLHYVGVWEPKTFVIEYRYKIDGVDYEMESTEGDGIMRSCGYEDTLELAVPAFKRTGEIFSHWTGSAGVAGAGRLYPNRTTISMRDLVAAVGSQRQDDGTYVVRLYAAWSGVVNSEVPLMVSIAFDPEHPEDSFVVSDAWISTRSTDPVFVESVTLQKADETASAFAVAADDGTLTDGSEYVHLTVKGDAVDGTAQAKTLKLNLGRDTVVRGVAAYGLGVFDSTQRINVTYGLDFSAEGCPAPTAFTNLNDRENFKDARNPDGTRKSYTLARLFYTIGLVPPASNTA